MATLTTPRLLLRRWREDDIPAMAAVSADPEVMRWIGDGSTADDRATAAAVARCEESWDQHEFGLFAVEISATGELAGFAGLAIPNFMPEVLPAVEIGWRLGRRHWGRGIATEAARAALRFGFADRASTVSSVSARPATVLPNASCRSSGCTSTGTPLTPAEGPSASTPSAGTSTTTPRPGTRRRAGLRPSTFSGVLPARMTTHGSRGAPVCRHPHVDDHAPRAAKGRGSDRRLSLDFLGRPSHQLSRPADCIAGSPRGDQNQPVVSFVLDVDQAKEGRGQLLSIRRGLFEQGRSRTMVISSVDLTESTSADGV
jgi:RimJ/RimL family protein N-acetyltransferase